MTLQQATIPQNLRPWETAHSGGPPPASSTKECTVRLSEEHADLTSTWKDSLVAPLWYADAEGLDLDAREAGLP
jgi:hypothetical protein